MTSIVRLATTAIANRAGFDLDQSDDLNTALEEVFRYFCSSCSMDGDNVNIFYSIHDNKLQIRAGDTLNSLSDNDTKIGRYCRFILDKVTDSYSELSERGRFAVVIEKQTSP
jgi:anti-sigma regulatory factor (Ser/Thr protein kinase)